MPARGYEYFLLVFKSISHSFALAALTRRKHEKIKISIHKRHVIFCKFNSYFQRALVLLDDNVVK